VVFVQRRTKDTIIRWIRDRTNEQVNRAIGDALAGKHVASLTMDNDCAFAQHPASSSRLRAPVYFARLFRSANNSSISEYGNVYTMEKRRRRSQA
jgi:IS30 family transposase